MKKNLTIRTFLLLAATILGARAGMYAQSIANYNTPTAIQRSTGISYNSIEFSGYSIPAWRNDVAGTSNQDDNRSYQVPIGFDFWYDGTRYTQFSASTNGFVDFSASTNDGGPGINTRQYYAYGPYDEDLSMSTRTQPAGGSVLAIAPMYYDLTTQGELDPLGNSIKYLLTGVEPNRVLTIEWIRMAVWGNTTPDLNFQLKLYEGSGVVQFVYGTMTTGTVGWLYSCGINGPTLSATPTTAQLLLQQTANSTTFTNGNGNAAQNLTTVPAANSMITFTPPVPSTPTNLTFTNPQQTSMTLNWTDVATNEVGYVIYRSDDGGATYYYMGQLAANSTSSTQTGLAAGTTYNWRVYAVTEGALSSALSGSQATSAPATFTSINSGNWSNPQTWNPTGNAKPDISSAVTISNGHTVTIDSNAFASSITVGQGTSGILAIGNSDNLAKIINVAGNITVNTGGNFSVNTASVQSGHTINVTGNIVNSGTFNMAPTGSSQCIVNFNKSGSQTISGNGSTTNFYLMNLNMGASSANVLDVFATNFTNTTSGFLTITNGTFKLSAGGTVYPFSASATVPQSGGLWLNHASAIVNTTGGDLSIAGYLRVSNGATLNVGSATDHRLISNGGIFTIDNGTINVAGRFEPANGYNLTNFTMSNGTFNVPTIGSTSAVNAPFTINVAGSYFEMTGGTIVIKKAGGTNLGYINRSTSSSSVLGGTLQIGDASTTPAQTMQINTDIPVYNLTVNNALATGQLVTSSLVVKNNVLVSSGVLDANNLNLTVGGNWTDNGSSVSFLPGTGTVTLNNSAVQTLSDPTGETFNNLTINKTGGSVTLSNNVTVNSAFTLTQGAVMMGSTTLTLNGAVASNGTLTMSTVIPFGTVNYSQASAGQTILLTNYGNLTLSAFAKMFPATGSVGVANILTVPNPATAHTVTGSTIDFNGSTNQNVAATTANFTYNNLTLSNGGTKTAAGAISINGAFVISSGIAFADGGFAISAKGNVTNSGSHSGAGSVQLTGGAASHLLMGAGTYTNLVMNDANGATLSGNLTVNGILTFTAGVITSGTDTVLANSTVTRTSGHVNGWLRKNIAATGSNVTVNFELGDPATANYTPASFTFASVTHIGTLAAGTTPGQHPFIAGSYIDPTDDVDRYWTLTPDINFAFDAALKYTVTFTFLASDLSQAGNVANYRINRYAAAAWDSCLAGTIHTATQNQGIGLDLIGTYVIGTQNASNMYRSVASGDWTTPATWQRFNGPTGLWVAATTWPKLAAASITIQSPNTVTVTTFLSGTTNGQDQVIIEGGGRLDVTTGGTFQVRAGAGTDLTVYGTLRNSGGTISTNGGPLISIESGGKYLHSVNGGTVLTATWQNNSTCEIAGAATINTVPAGLGQSFSNFLWNCAGQNAGLNLAGNPTSITGSFTVNATGGQTLTLNDNTSAAKTIGKDFVVASTSGTVVVKSTGATAYAVSVGGNVSLTGAGTTTLTSSNAGGNVTMTVAGNVTISTGTLNFSSGSTTSTINVAGDFSHASGTMTETSSGNGSIVFNGSKVQTYTSGGTVSNIVNYTVNSGTTLQLGNSVLTGGGAFTLASGASIELGSTAGITSTAGTGNVQVTGARTFNTGANYIYDGAAGAQATGNQLPATVNHLTVNNAAGVTLTNSTAIADTLFLLNGNFAIGANTMTLNSGIVITAGTFSAPSGTVIYNQGTNGQNVIVGNYGNLTFSNFNKVLPPSSTIGIAGTFTPGTATGHTMTNSTVNYNGGAQSIAVFPYYNLTTSGSGTKTLLGNATVTGALTLSAGTFVDGGFTLTVNGNISNTVSHTGTGWIYLNSSSSAHLLTGGGSYGNVEINDGNGATVTGNTTINGTLLLTRGIISTSDTIFISTTGMVSRPVTGLPRHLNGFLKKTIPVNAVPQTTTFDIGTSTDYTPVVLTFNSVGTAGTVTASTVSSDHPNIKYSGLDQAKDANRYWMLHANGIVYTTYDATFSFVPADLDPTANIAYFFVKRFMVPFWAGSTTAVRTSTSTQATGLSWFGAFAVGEASNIFYWTRGAGTPYWGDDNNWSPNSKPTTANDVVFDGHDTVDVNIAGVCRNLTIQNDTLLLTIKGINSLTLSGNLSQQSGKFFTENAFPTIVGATLSGGAFGYSAASGSQSIVSRAYHSLILTGGGTKTAQGVFSVDSTMTITTGVTFADGGFTATAKQNIVHNGTHSGTGAILLTGGAASHLLSGNGTYGNLQLNDANGASISGHPAVSGVLTLTSGNITTGTDSLTINNGGSISRTSGHIVGLLNKYVATGTPSVTFEIGTGASYTPMALAFAIVTSAGTLTATTKAGDHDSIAWSGLSVSKSVNRTWTVRPSNIVYTTYAPTLTFVAGDIDGGAATGSFVIRRYYGTTWSATTTGARTATTTSASGVSGVGDFQIGQQRLSSYAVTAPTPAPADTVFTTTVAAKDTLGQTIADDNTTVMTMSGTGLVQFDGNGDGTYGDVAKTFTAGTFAIKTRDTVAQTITITATDASFRAGVSSNIVIKPGTLSKLVITLPGETFAANVGNFGTVTTQSVGVAFTIPKITATDVYFNIKTTYAGAKTLSYSGPGGTPSYINAVTFANGQSTTTLTTTLDSGQTTAITASDASVPVTGPPSSSLQVTSPNLTLGLTQSATNPAPGDQVEYAVTYSNAGNANATNTIVTLIVPNNTTYVGESLLLKIFPAPSFTPLADATSGVTLIGSPTSTITLNLSTIVGNITPAASGIIKYKVQIK